MGRTRRTTLLLVAVGLLSLALLAAAAPLASAAHQSVAGAMIQMPYFGPFALVGLVIAYRQPRNPIGWILLAITPVYMTGADAGTYAVVIYHLGHTGLPFGRLAVSLTQTWIFLPLLIPVPILLFPDGKVPGGRWRWTVRAYAVACVLLVGGLAARDLTAFTVKHVRVDHSGELVSLGSNGSGGIVAAIGFLAFLVYLACALSWVARQLLVFRRSTGDRRQQLKWLMAGAASGTVGFACSILCSGSSSLPLRVVGGVGFGAVVVMPVSLGIGVLKYRLYDIDRVISRTVSYATVTGLLIAVYIGIVALATHALPLSSPAAVAVSTLSVAALFTPLRQRVQRSVDRRFNRARYDAQATVERFSASLRDAVDLELVQRELIETVDRIVEPVTLSVWLAH